MTDRMAGLSKSDLTFRSGGGCLMLFGLPFLLFGIMGIYMAAAGMGEPKENAWVGYLVGTILGAIGMGFVFGRSEISFDPAARRWHRWWGMLGFKKKKEGSLDDLTEVEITREVRHNKNSSYTVYPVRVKGAGDLKLTIEEPREFDKARRLGEKLGKGIGIPLADSSGGTQTIVKPEDMDDNIKQKIREGQIELEQVPEPSVKASKYEVDGTTVRFSMPTGGLMDIIGGIIAMVVIPAFVGGIFLLPLLKDDSPAEEKWIIAAVIGAIFILGPILGGLRMILKSIYGREGIEVSPQGIKWWSTFGPFTKKKEIPAEEVEEVKIRSIDSGGTMEITVLSDNVTISFGKNLSDNEKRWIASVVQTILAA
jgi:hypothetical protein